MSTNANLIVLIFLNIPALVGAIVLLSLMSLLYGISGGFLSVALFLFAVASFAVRTIHAFCGSGSEDLDPGTVCGCSDEQRRILSWNHDDIVPTDIDYVLCWIKTGCNQVYRFIVMQWQRIAFARYSLPVLLTFVLIVFLTHESIVSMKVIGALVLTAVVAFFVHILARWLLAMARTLVGEQAIRESLMNVCGE